MYNLARIYYFGDDVNVDIKKSISLLIKSSSQFYQSKLLLFLILIKDLDVISVDSINDELKKYDFDMLQLAYDLYIIFSENGMKELSVSDPFLLENFRFFDYFYSNIYTYSSSDLFLNPYKENDQIIPNINDEFYKGFGIVLD